MSTLRLHNFHSSSTSYRVRIGLALKGLAYEYVPVTLRWRDGDNDAEAYRTVNPQANVPLLEHGELRVAQSMAILEYLDETFPARPLLPPDPAARARVRSIAQYVACDIQGPNNLRIERYLANDLALSQDALTAWRRRWITNGFDAIERMLASGPTGTFCHGDTPTLADCFLVPQVYNSLRPTVALDVATWPTIARVWQACMAHPAFEGAQPKHQPGYENLTQH